MSEIEIDTSKYPLPLPLIQIGAEYFVREFRAEITRLYNDYEGPFSMADMRRIAIETIELLGSPSNINVKRDG